MQPSTKPLKVSHSKKWTGIDFEGIFPVLKAGEPPHEVTLQGPCGLVSEDSGKYLNMVGSFGVQIAPEAVDRYMQLQAAILREEEVSVGDMFFLLDAVRRSKRRNDHEEASSDDNEEAVGEEVASRDDKAGPGQSPRPGGGSAVEDAPEGDDHEVVSDSPMAEDPASNAMSPLPSTSPVATPTQPSRPPDSDITMADDDQNPESLESAHLGTELSAEELASRGLHDNCVPTGRLAPRRPLASSGASPGGDAVPRSRLWVRERADRVGRDAD